MPLVGKVGRKRFRARFAMGVLYLLLTIGAVTTVFPFLTMVSTGFKGPTDQNDNKLVPSFWTDDAELLTKYRDDKYAGDAAWIASAKVGPEASPAEIKDFEKLLMELPPTAWLAGFRTPANHVTSRLNTRYQNWLADKYKVVAEVNAAYSEINGSIRGIAPPPERLDQPGWKPKGDQKWKDWLEFKQTLPAEFRIPVRAQRLWQEWQRTAAKNQIDAVPKHLVGTAKAFEELVVPPAGPELQEFVAKGLPVEMKPGSFPEDLWSAQGHSGELPVFAAEKEHVRSHAQDLRAEFSGRNYRYVVDNVALDGRALLNTALFCLLTIIVQLTVNPIAAYALSRYPMKATAQILLFLLATMAFPAEVAMIPSFLLLKDLGLLNTFAALVLPTAASGFMIFLLKGFFDSLPQEVFESGQLDGAPEWVMMLKLAFPLSRPVFGYLALLAFMSAYGAFIYAFLVAQDRHMWTLMVYVYQLQLVAPKSVMMAAVTLVALPTLVVFLLAQRVIMRGIVLPGER